jgi:hypothetical protein
VKEQRFGRNRFWTRGFGISMQKEVLGRCWNARTKSSGKK